MFKRITDPQQIRAILDGFIHKPEAQKASFVPVIFSREHRPGGIAYEGHKPIAACQTDKERVYTLATSDSKHSRSVGTIQLSKVEYLDVFPEMVPSKIENDYDGIGSRVHWGSELFK